MIDKELLRPYANLYGADLCEADLYGADLREANLREANLYGANLRGANLYGADLYGANLREANLYGADLYGANLYGANLYGANLYGANLCEADLYGANLREANLREANLYGANLRGADLYGAKDVPALAAAQTLITPAGTITGWKVCRNRVIVQLRIPAKAARCNATGRKCRAAYAKVIAVDGAEVAYSQHDSGFAYLVGDTVRPTEPFDHDRWNECSSGIHFFLTREEAENWT